jgi:hypothetical protein
MSIDINKLAQNFYIIFISYYLIKGSFPNKKTKSIHKIHKLD